MINKLVIQEVRERGAQIMKREVIKLVQVKDCEG